LNNANPTIHSKVLNIHGVGIVGRPNTPSVTKYISELIDLLEETSIPYVIDSSLSSTLKEARSEAFSRLKEFPSWANLLIILGGDGTILKAVHSIPNIMERYILGVNVGTIGFLAEIEPESIKPVFSHIINKRPVYLEKSRLLYLSINERVSFYVLNEILILSLAFGKVMSFEVFKDDIPLYKGNADGLILSTKTGSTAYIASLGGPIVDPSLEVILFGLLCPLRWSFRPIILPSNSQIRIRILRPGGFVIGDGLKLATIKGEFHIISWLSDSHVNFIRLSKDSFYNRLRRRLTLEI